MSFLKVQCDSFSKGERLSGECVPLFLDKEVPFLPSDPPRSIMSPIGSPGPLRLCLRDNTNGETSVPFPSGNGFPCRVSILRLSSPTRSETCRLRCHSKDPRGVEREVSAVDAPPTPPRVLASPRPFFSASWTAPQSVSTRGLSRASPKSPSGQDSC